MRRGAFAWLVWASSAAAAVAVSQDPPRVVLGRGETVRLRVSGAHPGVLRTFASAGALLKGPSLSHEVDFTWTPPQSHVPGLALLAFWNADEGEPSPALAVIPMLGRTDLEVDTEPSAEVIVEVGDARFGPVKANGKGKARVAVEVPPGTTSANVLAKDHGRQTTRTVPLAVPLADPLSMLLDPNPLPKEGGALLVLDAETLDPSSMDVRAQGATTEFAASSPHWERFRIVPVQGAERVSANVTWVGHDEATASAEASVALAPASLPSEAPLVHHRWYPSAALGAFYGGDSHAGILLDLGGGYRLRTTFPDVALDLNSGVQSYGVSITSGGAPINASAIVVPIVASARVSPLERGPWRVGGSLGGGIGIYSLNGGSLFTPNQSGGGVVPEGFVGIEGAYLDANWEIFADLQGCITGTLATSGSPGFQTSLDGMTIRLGARYGSP